MTPKFSLEVPFETKPPRLKDLVNRHMMGQVWIRDTPFGPVTDSLILSEKFNVRHDNILKAIKKCQNELSHNTSYRLDKNIIENFSMLRQFALNLIKQGPSKKAIRRKQNIAGWDEKYLLEILIGHRDLDA